MIFAFISVSTTEGRNTSWIRIPGRAVTKLAVIQAVMDRPGMKIRALAMPDRTRPPGDLPYPGIEPRSLVLQADSLSSE